MWYDNWIREGDLYTLETESREWDMEYQKVSALIKDGKWDESVLSQLFIVELLII